MKKKIVIGIIIALCVIIAATLTTFYFIDMKRMENGQDVFFSTWGLAYGTLQKTENVKLVLSLEDEITEDSAWCGTFNLIWNDLKNELAKQDIMFEGGNTQVVNNLNKGTFNTNYLSENSYYKVYGEKSPELKRKIEKAIKEKFNETSSILDSFDWERNPIVGSEPDYFLYAMLKKEFEFPKVFTELENSKFGTFEDVKYFGINSSTDDEVRNQVKVLYYVSKEDFAIKLITKDNDEVVISKGSSKKSFKEVYDEIIEKQENYIGNASFGSQDTLKIPNISFNIKEELKEIQDKSFLFKNGKSYHIEKAMQTIEFELDKKGGRIKSEAGMDVKKDSIMLEEKPRNFLVDNTFTIFLKENEKELPYFAAKISNIKNYQ